MKNREIKFKYWSNKYRKFENTDEMPTVMGDPLEAFELIPYDDDVFCQFTGLCDKNEKEIYEGDILGYGKLSHIKYKVVYDKGSFKLHSTVKYFPRVWGNLSRLFDPDMRDIYNNIKVIGNIHENPELI